MLVCCPWMVRAGSQRYDEIDETPSPARNGGPAVVTETSSLLRSSGDDSLVEAYFASYRSWQDDINLWTDPYDVTHQRSAEDKELDALIVAWRKAHTEEEKKLIYQKMQSVRLRRKRVQDRWKSILSDLGFSTEADRLVSVGAASGVTVEEDPSEEAAAMHRALVNESELFGDGEVQARRYTIVMDRLIALDVAQDFIKRAKELYPAELSGI